jgi:GNAT superfamily N-acetyltransferase
MNAVRLNTLQQWEELVPQFVPLIMAASGTYLTWLLGSPSSAESMLRRWLLSSHSAYSASRALVCLNQRTILGLLIAFGGHEYPATQKHDTLELIKSTASADRPALTSRLRSAQIGEPIVRPDDYLLRVLSVAPEARGQGIGRQLMETAIQQGKNLSYRRFKLFVESNNSTAIQLYRKLGFQTESQFALEEAHLQLLCMTRED